MYLIGKKSDSTWMTLHMSDEIAFVIFPQLDAASRVS